MKLMDADNLNFEGQKYNKSQMKSILDFIDAQPTAYDVDAVVEQLEELKSRYGIEGFGIKGIICKAIEIVKGGGVK